MDNDEILDQLIDRWESLRAATTDGGRSEPSAEEICADHPELVDRFQEAIRNLSLFDNVFGMTEGLAPGTPGDVGEFCHGRFKVEAFHDQGGLGTLFLARDTELDRLVIVKGIRPERSSHPESRRQFVNEAAITGQLEHPGIVPVYGFGRDDHRRPFYAMRMIRGMTLREAIRKAHQENSASGERNVAFRRLLRDFVSVCQTIGFAHSRGVIHRDIKPSNVMIGRFGEVLVVDWGLAKHVAGSAGEAPTENHEGPPAAGGPEPLSIPEPSATLEGTIKGSPTYMSPEQAAGHAGEVGPASDVYALGATLYEILTGRAPFAGGSGEEIVERVKRGELIAPRAAASDVPPALEAICLQAMRLDPRGRYDSAQALADEIERWLADEPVRAYGEPLVDRLRRWGRRHRTLVVGAAAGVLVAFAASVAASGLLKAKNDELVRANERAGAAEREAVQRAEDLERALYANRMARAGSAVRSADVRKVFGELAATKPELRSLEWNYARRLAAWPPRLSYQMARPLEMAEITGLVAGPDGKWLVTEELEPTPGGDPLDRSLSTHLAAAADGVTKIGMGAGFLAFSHDGTSLLRRKPVANEGPGRYKLSTVDLATGRTIWETITLEGPVVAAAFFKREDTDPPLPLDEGSPAVVATIRTTAADGKTVHAPVFEFRDPKSGKLLETVKGEPTDDFAGARFSPDGRLFAMGGSQASISSTRTGKKLYSLAGPPGLIYSLAFSADGRRIAARGENPTGESLVVHTYDAADGKLLNRLWGHAGSITTLAFSRSGERLASVGKDGGIRMWNVADGAPQGTYLTHDKLTQALAFGGDEMLYAGGTDGVVRAYDLRNVPAGRVIGEEFRVSKVRLSPSGDRLAAIGGVEGTTQSAVRIYDRATGTVQARVELPNKSTLGDIGFSADGKTLFIAGDDFADNGNEFVRLVGAHDGKLRWEYRNVGIPAAFVGDGDRLAAARPSRPLVDVLYGDKLWDQVQGNEARTFFQFRKSIFEVRPSHRLGSEAEFHRMGDKTIVELLEKDPRDAGLLATLRDRAREAVVLLDTETGQLQGTLDVEASRLAVSLDGRLLAVAGEKEISFWEPKTGKRIGTLPREARVWSMALSPDGASLVVNGYRDSSATVIDVKTGEVRHLLDEHLYPIQEVAYTPDGRRIVTCAVDGTVRIWDAETGVPLWTIAASKHGIYSLDVSRDGRYLATSGGSEPRPGEMIVWDVSPAGP